MKKISIFLVLLFMLSLGSMAHAAEFNVNLRYGSPEKSEVLKLQNFLFSKGFLTVAPTGNYYNVTKRAVELFQAANGLQADGLFGPASRAVANAQVGAGTSPSFNSKPTVQLESISDVENGSAAILANSKRIEWQTSNYPAGAGVDINLIRKTSDTPSRFVFVRKAATNTPNDGEEIITLGRGETGSDIYVEVTCSSTFDFQAGCQLLGTPVRVN